MPKKENDYYWHMGQKFRKEGHTYILARTDTRGNMNDEDYSGCWSLINLDDGNRYTKPFWTKAIGGDTSVIPKDEFRKMVKGETAFIPVNVKIVVHRSIGGQTK
jgi:hypothetical protein